MILKIVPKAANKMGIFADFSCIHTGKEAETEILMRLSKHIEHGMEESKIFSFSLYQGILTNQKLSVFIKKVLFKF